MATFSFIHVDLPEASRLADLTGISADLRDAQELAGEFQNLFAEASPKWWTAEALTIAILIKYSRPFSIGCREKLKIETLPILNAEQRNKHKHLMAFRNKHIAHSVNAYEHNQPIARYVKGREYTEGVYEVGCQHGRVIGLSRYEIEAVIELTTAILDYVDNELSEEKKTLLRILRNIPFAELLSKEKPPVAPGQHSDITKSRK